jgi:hypothetical protein
MLYNHLYSWLGSHNPPSPSINKPWSGQEFFMSPLGLHPWLNEKNMIIITCWKKIEHIAFILGIQSQLIHCAMKQSRLFPWRPSLEQMGCSIITYVWWWAWCLPYINLYQQHD